jgi:hypothetical protein
MHRLRFLVFALIAALLAGGLFFLPGADAGRPSITIDGTVDCILDEGGIQLVEWTVTNNLGLQITIVSAVVDDSGLTTGSAIDPTVTLTPNPVPSLGETSGFGAVTGDATGDLHLVVTYSFDGTFEDDGEIVLPGGCVPPATTTTEAPTTTTEPETTTTTEPEPTGAGAVPLQPTFTG